MTPEKSNEPGKPPRDGGLAEENLTVRDYFAGQALFGLLSSVESEERKAGPTDAAISSYEHADEMLRERLRKGDIGADTPAPPSGP